MFISYEDNNCIIIKIWSNIRFLSKINLRVTRKITRDVTLRIFQSGKKKHWALQTIFIIRIFSIFRVINNLKFYMINSI